MSKANTAVKPATNDQLPAAPAAAQLPAIDDSYLDSLPTGYDNVTSRDLIIPRLMILQGLSPQLDKNKPDYIEGAKSGDFCDVATGDVWKDGIDIIPCFYANVYLEWAPRASGKGLVRNYGTDEARAHKNAKLNEDRQWITAEGNRIIDTATFFVLNMSAGGMRSFIPLTSTQLKAARQWMTVITKQTRKRSDGTEVAAPIYWRVWHARSVGQSNAKGSWNGWKFAPGQTILELDPSGKLLREVVEFQEQARQGLVQGDFGEGDAEEDHSDKM